MFQNSFKHKIIQYNNDSFQKIPLRSHLPQQSKPSLPQLSTTFNQSSYQVHHQVPWNLETQVSSLLITRPTTKLLYQICLHKQERILSKIKPKALKPNLTIPRHVPVPKWEPSKHTRNSQGYNTTKTFYFHTITTSQANATS